MPTIQAKVERWPLARPFAIARGAKTAAEVVVATIVDGECVGRGECVPYPRYGESAAEVAATINAFDGPFHRTALLDAMPPGAARNAIDCALWDVFVQSCGKPAWVFAGAPKPIGVATAFTLSLDEPTALRERARAERWRPLLKVKLGADVDDDIERLRIARSQAPKTRLIVDANEGWNMAALEKFMPAAVAAGVELIEQPLPANADDALRRYQSPIPLAADESIHDGRNLRAVAARYQAINIKLDKTGGLTQALALARKASKRGLDVMVGCMVCTSLAIAPALLLSRWARFVDLDGPLLLARDRSPGLDYGDDGISWRDGVWAHPWWERRRIELLMP